LAPTERPDILDAIFRAGRISAEFRSTLAQATATDPRERHRSVRELEGALALEMARQHPLFSPSSVVLVLHRYVRSRAPHTAQITGVIESSEDRTVREKKGRVDNPPASQPSPEGPSPATTTFVPPRAWVRPGLILVAACALFSIGVLALSHSQF